MRDGATGNSKTFEDHAAVRLRKASRQNKKEERSPEKEDSNPDMEDDTLDRQLSDGEVTRNAKQAEGVSGANKINPYFGREIEQMALQGGEGSGCTRRDTLQRDDKLDGGYSFGGMVLGDFATEQQLRRTENHGFGIMVSGNSATEEQLRGMGGHGFWRNGVWREGNRGSCNLHPAASVGSSTASPKQGGAGTCGGRELSESIIAGTPI